MRSHFAASTVSWSSFTRLSVASPNTSRSSPVLGSEPALARVRESGVCLVLVRIHAHLIVWVVELLRTSVCGLVVLRLVQGRLVTHLAAMFVPGQLVGIYHGKHFRKALTNPCNSLSRISEW